MRLCERKRREGSMLQLVCYTCKLVGGENGPINTNGQNYRIISKKTKKGIYMIISKQTFRNTLSFGSHSQFFPSLSTQVLTFSGLSNSEASLPLQVKHQWRRRRSQNSMMKRCAAWQWLQFSQTLYILSSLPFYAQQLSLPDGKKKFTFIRLK